MEKTTSELEELHGLLLEYSEALAKIKKYSGNGYYKNKIKQLFIRINHSVKKVRRLIIGNSYFTEIEMLILVFIDKSVSVEKKEELWEKIELKWQDLALDLKPTQNEEIQTIPTEIISGEVRSDLEEAMRASKNACFLSSVVMCRRAYEGALTAKYKELEGKEPLKSIVCKNCKNTVKGNMHFGIVELHKWAVEKKIIPSKFRDVGFLVPNMGAGGAHPDETFPRDETVAKISITTTFALLKQIYSK